jgi:hypothetical protein
MLARLRAAAQKSALEAFNDLLSDLGRHWPAMDNLGA